MLAFKEIYVLELAILVLQFLQEICNCNVPFYKCMKMFSKSSALNERVLCVVTMFKLWIDF